MKALSLLMVVFAVFAVALAAEDAKSTTLTGCLQAGAKDGSFMLSSEGKSYELMPAATVDLKAHVGHKIEVTGTVDDAAAHGDKAAPAGDQKAAAAHSHFKVTAMKHVAPTCP